MVKIKDNQKESDCVYITKYFYMSFQIKFKTLINLNHYACCFKTFSIFPQKSEILLFQF